MKTLVTLAVIGVFSVLALRGDLQADDVKDIVYIVIAFYFGTQLKEKNGTADVPVADIKEA